MQPMRISTEKVVGQPTSFLENPWHVQPPPTAPDARAAAATQPSHRDVPAVLKASHKKAEVRN